MANNVSGAPLPPRKLEAFLTAWALPTENQRSRRRWAASSEEFRQFYEAVLPVMDELLEYLDSFELGALPSHVRPYYWLALAFAEAAPHVELYKGSAQVPNSFSADRMVAARGEQVDE